MTSRPPLSAEVFDAAFREAATSEWTQRVLGADLPPDVDAYSFITLDGLREVARLVADCHGGTLLDLACGRGGPGLWLARQIGAHLIGIDFSPVGIEHATAKAAEIAPDVQVRYIVADATATTLPSDSVDGLVCVDAIQLMADRAGVMAEVRRVLKPDALAAFTTWEEAERLADLAALFESAGLVVLSVNERPDWLARERDIFNRALADAPNYPDDAALQSLAEEAETALPLFDQSRRVLGVAQKPH
jgi:ubiquinone/menaquinone biosynthesis C-methylase UbiE